jgi:hypothetical protein
MEWSAFRITSFLESELTLVVAARAWKRFSAADGIGGPEASATGLSDGGLP